MNTVMLIPAETSTQAAMLGVVFAVVLSLGFYVWSSLALAAVFRKVGEEPWQAWVPILNTAVVLRIGGYSPMLVLVVLIPVLGSLALAVLLIICAHRINQGFGLGGGMTVVAVLSIPIWASIIGWGQSTWRGLPQAAGAQPAFGAGYGAGYGAGGYATGGYGSQPGQEAGGYDPGAYGVPGVPAQPDPAGYGYAEPAPTAPWQQQAPAWQGGQDWQGSQDWQGGQGSQPTTPTWAAQPVDSWSAQPVDSWSAQPWQAQPTGSAPSAELWDGQAGDDGVGDSPTRIRPKPWETPGPEVVTPGQPAVPAAPAWLAPDAAAPAAPAWAAPEAAVPAGQPWAVDPAPVPVVPESVVPVAPAWAAEPAPVSVVPESVVPVAPAWAAEPAPVPVVPESVVPVAPAWAAEPAPVPVVPESAAPAVPAWALPEAYAPAAPVWTAEAPPAPASAEVTPVAPPVPIDRVPGFAEAGDPWAPPVAFAAATPATLPRVADEDDPEALEQTMLAVRSRPRWYLVTSDGTKLALTGETVVVGRNPSAIPAEPGVQLLAVPDTTRTISKQHARLELSGGVWRITDLGSTNGVTLVDPDGTERGLGDSGSGELTLHFFLGDAELRLVREGTGV